jgi:dienelactone hydrolase
MKKYLYAVPLALLAFVSIGIASKTSNFTFGVTFGPHPVGFRVVYQYDYSRVYKPAFDLEGKPATGERARPIQTLIWYPAQPDKSAKPILYGRYLELLATEQSFDGDNAQKAALLQFMLEQRGMMGKYDIERVQPTHAFSEAKPASGSFPVVIYAPSFTAPAFENSDLCEYLASHGYIVVASPDMGPRTRWMTQDVVGIQTQAADIEFLIGYLRNIPQADTSHIAVAGYSWGGISNVFAQVQDDRISALVCLDGTIRSADDILKEAKYVTASRVTVPLLFLASGSPSLLALSYDVSAKFLNDIKYSDFQIVLFNGMEHQDFSSLFLRFRPDEQFTAYTAAEVSESHSWMARYVLHFLNAYLKNDGTAREFLKNSPEKNGAPRHQLVMQSRPALHPAPTVADFARELAKQGFDKAISIWQEAKKKDSCFMLPEQEVNAFGFRLMRAGKLNEAIAVFKLNVAMYPENFDTYVSLAEAQVAAGDKQSAIANYKKALELNSGNTNAVNRLKKLESNPIK